MDQVQEPERGMPAPNAPVEGVYSMELETTADLARSGWLAARVLDHPDLKSHILPRELSVFAHTARLLGLLYVPDTLIVDHE